MPDDLATISGIGSYYKLRQPGWEIEETDGEGYVRVIRNGDTGERLRVVPGNAGIYPEPAATE